MAVTDADDRNAFTGSVFEGLRAEGVTVTDFGGMSQRICGCRFSTSSSSSGAHHFSVHACSREHLQLIEAGARDALPPVAPPGAGWFGGKGPGVKIRREWPLCGAQKELRVFSHHEYGDTLPVWRRYFADNDEGVGSSTSASVILVYASCERKADHEGKHCARGMRPWTDEECV